MNTESTENLTAYAQQLGSQAKTAATLMASASAAIKNRALRNLAALLRANVDALASIEQQCFDIE